MLFGRKKNSPELQEQNDPALKRKREIERLEGEREELNGEIEALLKEYSRAIGSRAPIKGARPAGTQPSEYGFWHKKHRR